MMARAFASQSDLKAKEISFTQLADNVFAYTAEGDPNTGVIIGDEAVMVVDTQATPVMAADVLRKIRSVTDKPVKYIFLTHYHAVRVLGASAYGADHIVSSQDTYDLIVERGEADFKSEYERFPRLFQDVDSIPGLTWPNITFKGEMRIWLGETEVRLLQLGRGHTKGDSVVWLPEERVLFSGDLVEYGATPYMGDGYLEEWPKTLDRLVALEPRRLVPGRGDALTTPESIDAAITDTREFVSAMYCSVREGRKAGKDLRTIYRETYDVLKPRYGQWVIFDHCLPFDVARAYDESGGIRDPKIWTAERDASMWKDLES